MDTFTTSRHGHATASIVTRCGVTVQAMDMGGGLILAGPLTSCCGAAATGADGIVCKACGRQLADAWGGPAWGAVHAAVIDAGCLCADACTDHALWAVEDALAR